MRISLFGLIIGIAVMTACAPAGPRIVAPLSATPELSGGTYSSGGGLTVAADIREFEGKTLVCGVWALSSWQSALTVGVEPTVIGSGSVFLDREVLVRGLAFMRRVSPMADYGGQEAGCALSNRAWQPGDEARRPTIRIPRQVVAVEDGGFGGFVVTFRQTGPGAGTK